MAPIRAALPTPSNRLFWLAASTPTLSMALLPICVTAPAAAPTTAPPTTMPMAPAAAPAPSAPAMAPTAPITIGPATTATTMMMATIRAILTQPFQRGWTCAAAFSAWAPMAASSCEKFWRSCPIRASMLALILAGRPSLACW